MSENQEKILLSKNEMTRNERKKQSDEFQQKLESAGVKVTKIMRGRFYTTSLLFEGLLKRFIDDYNKAPSVPHFESISYSYFEKETGGNGLNAVEIVDDDLGILGRIGVIRFDRFDLDTVQIMISAYPVFPKIAPDDLNDHKQGFKEGEKLMRMISNYIMENLSSVNNPQQYKTKFSYKINHGKRGRRHYEDDIWANQEVFGKGRQTDEVYKEWIERDGVKSRDLRDPKRSYSFIISPYWNKEKNE